MSVLENFKNIPRSPYGGRQALNVIFFLKFVTRSLAGGARVQGGPVAPPRATGGPRPQARQGGLSPPPPRATGSCPPT